MSHKSCFLAGLAAMLVLACGMPAFAGKPPAISYRILQLALVDQGNVTYQRSAACAISTRDLVTGQSQVLGSVIDAAGNGFPARWTIGTANGVQSELKLLRGTGEGTAPPTAQTAYGNNDSGEIVGVGVEAVGSHTVGVYWANENAAPQALPPLEGDDIGSLALAINNEGVICGSSVHQVFQGENTLWCHRAVVWRVSPSGDVHGPIELPPAQSHAFASAAAVSDNDTMTGYAKVVGWSSQEADGTPSAVAWHVQWDEGDTPAFVDFHARVLGGGAIGEASGVNNAGMICGCAESGWGVVWTNESATPTTLAYNRYVAGRPRDINKYGMSVGYGWYHKMWVSGPRALMWSSPTSSLIMLDQFLDDSSPYGCLTDAYAVNDSGEIIGSGWDGSIYTAFVAVPK